MERELELGRVLGRLALEEDERCRDDEADGLDREGEDDFVCRLLEREDAEDDRLGGDWTRADREGLEVEGRAVGRDAARREFDETARLGGGVCGRLRIVTPSGKDNVRLWTREALEEEETRLGRLAGREADSSVTRREPDVFREGPAVWEAMTLPEAWAALRRLPLRLLEAPGCG